MIDMQAENEVLKKRIVQLEQELAFLRMHDVFLQGLKGETLVAQLTDGRLTSFAAEHDLVIGTSITIEVKFSKLNIPHGGAVTTRRWNWSKPMGWKDKGKQYDFLVLVGEKDPRYPEQYPDNSPYIFFLIPRHRVPEICTSGHAIGANVQITSNLANAKSAASTALKQFIVPATSIAALLTNASPSAR